MGPLQRIRHLSCGSWPVKNIFFVLKNYFKNGGTMKEQIVVITIILMIIGISVITGCVGVGNNTQDHLGPEFIIDESGRLRLNPDLFGENLVYDSDNGILRSVDHVGGGDGYRSDASIISVVNSMDNTTFDNITLNDFLLLNGMAAEPTNPVEGMIYSNSSDHHCYYYNGTRWRLLSVVVSSGTAANAYNGSWIAHGLPSDPHGSGSITLSLRGSSSIDATHILREPTVIQSNNTHFQIEFLMWNSTDWELYPVLVGDGQTVYWDAVFRG